MSAAIKALYPDAKIVAADISPSMIAEVDQRITSKRWKSVTADVLDARNLSSLSDEMFSHVFMNLGLPAQGRKEREYCGSAGSISRLEEVWCRFVLYLGW